MKMRLGTIAAISSAFLLTALNPMPAQAGPGTWNRGPVKSYAELPPGSSGPDGLAVGPDGNVYVTTFGYIASGLVPNCAEGGQLYVFRGKGKKGKLVRQVTVQPSSCNLLGIGFSPAGTLFVIDFGTAQVLTVDPESGAASVFWTAPAGPTGAWLNGLTFDAQGNVYVSDSFSGTIYQLNGNTGAFIASIQDPLLEPNKTYGVPSFGANGLAFDKAGDALFVTNTADDTIVKIPVLAGTPGTPPAFSKPEVFTNSINGADGLVLDACDNIWVAANQADEIDVVDPTGMVIAKLGDFGGVDKHGKPIGLLFPASLAFSENGKFLYISNLALDLRLVDLPQAVDSQWASMVGTYTISAVKSKIKPIGHVPRHNNCKNGNNNGRH
jgi:sugar lactone lactonase YvrE